MFSPRYELLLRPTKYYVCHLPRRESLRCLGLILTSHHSGSKLHKIVCIHCRKCLGRRKTCSDLLATFSNRNQLSPRHVGSDAYPRINNYRQNVIWEGFRKITSDDVCLKRTSSCRQIFATSLGNSGPTLAQPELQALFLVHASALTLMK